MAQKNHKIGIEVGYSLDKSGLQEVLSSLQTVISLTKKDLGMKDLSEDARKAKEEVKQVAQNLQTILSSSWNPKLNQLDLSKVNKEIKSAYGNISNLQNKFAAMGAVGMKGYNAIAREVLNTNLQLKQTNKLLDEMAISMKNTIKWGFTSSIFNSFSNNVQKAWDFSKRLDASLNDIRIVTGKSADEMARFAKTANTAATKLGASTKDFTDAALIYYQQGDSDEIANAKAEITLKTANVTGQSAAEVSEQLTAVWNGYKVDASEAEFYIDKLAAVAATTATDLEELSVGMSKVASAANLMGVDIDQLNATLATVVSVTRQAPESVGTAFKTIYARMGDIEAGLDAETTLGAYTEKMKEIAGIDVLTANGELRDMGEVIEEIGGKWHLYTREQQIALSQTMAGTRQYNNLLSLFDNWEMYTKALKESQEAAGTLDKQNAIYMDRIDAKLQQLSTTAERAYDTLFDEEALSSFLDIAIGGLSTVNKLIESLGGGLTSIQGLMGGITIFFRKQLAGTIEQQIENLEKRNNNLAGETLKRDIIQSNIAEGRTNLSDNATNLQVEYTAKILKVKDAFSNDDEAKALIEQQKELGILQDKIDKLDEYKNIFNEVKIEEKDLFSKLTDAESVTQDEFAEAIDKIQQTQEEIRQNNEELNGVLDELKSSTQKKYTDDSGKVSFIAKSKGDMLKTKKGKASDKESDAERKKILNKQLEASKGLRDLQKKLNKESKEYETINQKINKIRAKELLTAEDIEEISRVQKKLLNDKVKIQQQLEKGAEGIAEAESGARESLEQELQARQAIIDKQIVQKERQLAISSAMSAMGSLTTFASSANGFAESIGRALAGTESWGSALSKAILPLTTLVSSITKAKAAYTAYNAMQDAVLLKETLQVASKERLNGVSVKETVLKAKEILVAKGKKKITEEETAAILVQEGVLTKKQLANEGVIVSETVMQSVQKKGTATTLANAAAWWAHPIIAIAAVAALGVAAAIGAISKGMEENTKALMENNQETIEAEKENQKEIKSHIDLYNSYINLYEQYEQGKASKEEMAEASDKLIELLGRESVVVKSLKNDYEGLNKEILEARKKETKKLIESATRKEEAAKSNLSLEAAKDKGGEFFIGDWVGLGDVKKSKDGKKFNINWDFGFSGKDEESIYQVLIGKGMNKDVEGQDDYTYAFQGEFDATEEGIIDYYEKLQDIKQNYEKYGITEDQWEKSEVAQHIETILKNWEPHITEYQTSKEETQLYKAQLTGYNQNFKEEDSASEFDKKYDEYINKLKKQGMNDDEASKAAEDFLTNYSDGMAEAYDARSSRKELAKQLGLSLPELNEQAGDLSNSDFKLLMTETENINNINDLKNYAEKIKAQSKGQQLSTDIGYANSSIDSLMEGKDLTKEQLEDLQKLEDKYIELGQIQDKNSREYLQKLHEIRQALEDEAITQKEKVSKAFIEDAQQDLEIGIGTEEESVNEFKKTLKEITEAEYKVLIEVESDAQTDFDGIITSMEQIDLMAAKIGKDFIIAAEDIEEVNDVFPGILENATILADGTMKLDREVVASKMAAAQTEVQQSSQTTVAKLENQRDELLAKKEAALKIADIAKQMQHQEAMTVDQESDLNKALNTFKTDNATTTADYEKDTQKDVADTSKINSEAMAQNFSGAYKKMAEDSQKWAKAAQQNMIAATTGKGKTTSADINTKYSAKGSSGTVSTATKGELKSAEDIKSVINWKDVETYYSNLAQSYQQSANNMQGKIAEILARNVNFNKRTTGVGTGKGADPEKKKSGGKKDKEKEAEPLEAEKNIYHDIDVELENIANDLKMVQLETDKLVGQSKIDNLAEQYKLLNDQIDATAEKLVIAHGEQASLQAQLAALGVTFNSDGTIANYFSSFDKLLKAANSNPSNEAAKERFELFEELIDKYDDLITGTIPDLVQSMQEDVNEQIELKLEAFNQEIDLRLDMAEAERDWNNFYAKVVKDIDDDDIVGNAQTKLQDLMSYYKDDLDGVVQVGTKHIEDILSELKMMDKGEIAKFYGESGTNDRARALEDLQNYYEQLMSDLEEIHDLSDEIHESYIDMIEEAQDKFSEQVSTFGVINDLLEHDKNIIAMMYGEEAYSSLSNFYEKQEENYNKQLDFQKQQVEFWKMQMETAEEGSEAWDAAKENWVSAVEEWNSAIEAAIENLQDKYVNTINAIFQNLNNQVTNGKGLDYTKNQWDLVNKNADQYLDTINSIYKVQELQNKYLDAIEKTDSPTQQKKLNDLMRQETDYLREQDKLSQYDLDRANLKYELALKQIALEEAQQNKTQLRLRRDSQGNYTYQYTSDEDQVASIQQEISNLYNQLYNLDAEQYKNNLSEIYDVWAEFQERMAEAAQINDPEQRAAKELLIKEQYGELINGLIEKNENLQANLYQSTMSHLFDLYDQNVENYVDMSEEQKDILDQFINAETNLNRAAFDNMFDLYNINIEQFKNMTKEQQDILMSTIVPQWSSGVQQMTDKIIGEGGFLPVCKDAFEDLGQATKDYLEEVDKLQKNADVNLEDIKNGIDNVSTEMEELLKNSDELIDQYGDEINAIKGVIDSLDDLVDKYKDAETAAKKAVEEAYKYKQLADDKNADVDPNLNKQKTEATTPTTNKTATSNKDTGSSNSSKPSLGKGSYIDVKSGTKWYEDSYGEGKSGYAHGGKITHINLKGSHPYNIDGLGWVKKSDIVGYASGGYTGDWIGSEGHLAMLHKKELILNEQDTKNMLNAITILRNLTTDLGATLLSKMAAISVHGMESIGQNFTSTGLEQSVTINAEFPNVTKSNEIEEALNNLVNKASQHIQKNR